MKSIFINDDVSRDLYGEFYETISSQKNDSFHWVSLMLQKSLASLSFDAWAGIQSYCTWPEETGLLLVKNLPLDREIPPTPESYTPPLKRSQKIELISSASLVAISSTAGIPTAYIGEGSDSFIHNIYPRKKYESTQSNQGSLQELRFHNDITFDSTEFYKSNPDYLVLFCLRNTQQARTAYIESRDIVALLDETTRNCLRQPLFRMSAPYNYSRAIGKPTYSDPMPILIGPDEIPEVRYTASGVDPISSDAEKALSELNRTISTFPDATYITLQPGDALLINNRKGLHFREPFTPKYDGSDRWLKRCYVKRELWGLRHQTTAEAGVFTQG